MVDGARWRGIARDCARSVVTGRPDSLSLSSEQFYQLISKIKILLCSYVVFDLLYIRSARLD